MASKDDPDKPRCTGKRADGRPCRNTPVAGTTRCWHHSYKVPGRPGKLNPDLQERILDLVLEGNYIETAAQVAGVSKSTLHRWLRRADDVAAQASEHAEGDLEEIDVYSLVDPAEWIYLDFRHALKSAEAFAETELVRLTKSHALVGGWQAFMTILERRNPDRWGRRKVLDHRLTGALEAKGRVELVIPDPETAAAAARILADSGALDVVGSENTPTQEDP